MLTKKTIGIIGIGSMGKHYVRKFLENNYATVIYDSYSSAIEPFKDNDLVQLVNNPKQVADHADIIFASLPSPDISIQVALGESGIIHGEKTKIYIDLSTTGRDTAIKIAEKLTKANIQVLDAPVSGGAPAAENGTLAIMASGNQSIFREVEPLLNIIGEKIFYLGEEIGHGQTMKLVNNLMSASAMAITTEAVLLGAKAGLEPRTMIDVINAGTGRNAASEDKFPNFVLNEKYDYGGTISTIYKDLKLCMKNAEDLNHPLWLGSSVLQSWNYAMSHNNGNEDLTYFFEHWKKLTNTTV